MSDAIVVHPHQPDGGSCPYRSHQRERGVWWRESKTYFLRGSAAHDARKWALTRYMTTGELPSIDDCLDCARESIATRNEEEQERGGGLPPELVEAATDEALPIVATDCALVLPEIAPIVTAVEETLETEVAEGVILRGTPDIVGVEPTTGTGIILDLKTAGKSPGKSAEQNAALSTQLSLYAALYYTKHGTFPLHALQYVWCMKKGPKKETIERDGLKTCEVEGFGVGVSRTITTQRSRADVDAALLRVKYRVDADRNNFHPPANPGGRVSECADCIHWGHEDPTQRCPFVTQTRGLNDA